METLEKIEIIEEDTKNLFANISSCGLNGINAYPVEIEVNISGGLPNFILVGLPDAAINESKERVRAAIKSSGYEFPGKKIIINLAPADTKKAGPNYDLPIAIGILTSTGTIPHENINNLFIAGELGLSGKVRKISGVLSYAILAKSKGAKGIVIPGENKDEAALIKGLNIYPVSNVCEAIHTINNLEKTKSYISVKENNIDRTNHLNLSDVKGQILAKRALVISACGGHHLLMIGSPGSGKSMMAQRLTTILPPLQYEEIIEVTRIYSACGKLSRTNSLISLRPFRSPHHNISSAGLIGGGSIPQPGEISLSHRGVLFLDEFTEFQKSVLDSLRQALETKEITVSRSRKSCTFPCDFTLIAACNPCPCGYYGDSLKKCTCNNQQIKKYISKISGPIIDRIDLMVEVKRLTEKELIGSLPDKISDSEQLKDKIIAAQDFQVKRFKNQNITSNSHLSSNEIRHFCKIDKDCELILKEAIKTLMLTGRSYDRVLKVSRTIADLDKSDIIKDKHILEALQFRLNFNS